MSLLLQANVGPRCATSEPSPNWHWYAESGFGGAFSAGSVIGANIGFSGQTPVSITPTTTLLPAVVEPPIVGQTFVAPMNDVLSSSGCCSESFWTATTPDTFSSELIELAGTWASTPP